jgi:chloramphenicol 3-O phosphotransferase
VTLQLPQIILLNGTSSAGKTSLARALQHQLPGLWLRLGVDHFLEMTPRKFHGVAAGVQLVTQADGTVPVRLGPIGEMVIESFHRAVSAVASAEVHVIVDDVLFEPQQLADWLCVLANHDVFFVGVRCRLAELESRERARGDREPGQARSQLGLVHVHDRYDYEVDTTSTGTEACAAAIVAALEQRAMPSAFAALRARA